MISDCLSRDSGALDIAAIGNATILARINIDTEVASPMRQVSGGRQRWVRIVQWA
jgi:hypothetical protein